MIAVDTNLLVYALREEAPFHESAVQCLQNLAEATAPWAIPAPCLHELLAVGTHPRIFKPPTPLGVVIEFVESFLESPSIVVLSESDGYWPRLHGLVRGARVVGPKVHDARIAALCLHHGVSELWSADRDFSHFPELRTKNPLLSA